MTQLNQLPAANLQLLICFLSRDVAYHPWSNMTKGNAGFGFVWIPKSWRYVICGCFSATSDCRWKSVRKFGMRFPRGLKWSVSRARFLVGNEGAENERLGHPPVIVDFWGRQTCIVLPLFKSLGFWDHSSRNWGTCWRPMICRFSIVFFLHCHG